MKPADFLFLVAAIVTLAAIIRMAYHALKFHWQIVRRIATRWIAFAVAYLSIVVVVSLATPRAWIAIGEEQRFDDWCIAVQTIEHGDRWYDIHVRVSNRGRGREQAASDATLHLVANNGRTIEALVDDSLRTLRSRIPAGQSIDAVVHFEVPTDVEIMGIDVVHGAWPQWFIIGDRGSLFHKRPLVAVPKHGRTNG